MADEITAAERARQFGEAMCENIKHNVGELRKSGAWMGIELPKCPDGKGHQYSKSLPGACIICGKPSVPSQCKTG
jgi:hypothetical protein